ncbi:MAG: glycine cleavage system protein H [Chloroflexi bacterium]|nr:glycine cleavage system protein H [Chloroflexota bacterium]
MTVYYGCDIPEDLYFDLERDVWIRFEADQAVLGMTDIAQTRGGKLVNIAFKKPGKVVLQGKSAATIESAKWVGPFPMPFSGEIVETNEAGFKRDILLANKDPYGAGWLVKVRSANLEAERVHLLTGAAAVEAYKKKIEELQVKCFRCIDETEI